MIRRLKVTVFTLLLLAAATIVQAQGFGGAHNTLTITTRDSSIIESSLYMPIDTTETQYPLVILLHMYGQDRSSYRDLVPQLLAQNWAVLAMDFRGHGKSKFVRKRFRTVRELNAVDFQLMVGDLVLTLAEIGKDYPMVDTSRLAVVGASIGSTVGTKFAARSPQVGALVMLSPGIKYKRIPVDGALADYYKRPVMIMVGKHDEYSFASSEKLKDVAHGPMRFEAFDSDKHGTDLFQEELGADSLIVHWLGQYLK